MTSCVDNASSSTQDCNYQYNLCTMSNDNWSIDYCSLFCTNLSTPAYTVWIDYDSPQQLLEVRFSNGSLSNGVGKPKNAIITVPNLPLGEILDEETYYVGFTASTGLAHEMHTIQAWEFESSGLIPNPIAPQSSGLIPNPIAPQSSRLIPNPGSPEPKSRVALIASVSCGAVVALVLAGLSLYFWERPNGNLKNVELINSTLEATETSRHFTYRELSRATKNFSASELLSSGGFGDVYRGALPSGALVAIKRIKESKDQGPESFLAEATSLRQIRHRNLLQLPGWSHSRAGLFLVNDYMCNGSLDKWIYRKPGNPDANGNVKAVLSWTVLRSILAGVASGLEYLHEGWVQCVLHRDIKSSNVMLDADFNAYLGDFGLARLTDHNKMLRTTLLAGTLGYMAPEMMHSGRATKETDVYAFGIMVLEVVCGRPAVDTQATDETEGVLVDSVWRAHEAGQISKMADARLVEVETSNLEEADAVAAATTGVSPDVADTSFEAKMMVANLLHLGLLCCLPDPSDRPSMRMVNWWFQDQGAMDQLPPLPATKPHYNHQSNPMPLSIISGCRSSRLQQSSSTRLGSSPSHTESLAKAEFSATENCVS